MYGCLLSILSHLAFSVLVAILSNSFVVGGICFFSPLIYLIVYFLFHKEEGALFMKKIWPFLLAGGIFILFCAFMIWQNAEKKKDEEAMDLYYGSRVAERYLGECREKLPNERALDKSYYLNASDEMKGMTGKNIIGNLEYGMSPRELFDEGDSLTIAQCVGISSKKIYPLRDFQGMFDNQKRLYGVQLEYYYAWGGREDWDAEVEDGLKEVIDKLKHKYGEPTVDFRSETDYHVKWNAENQVIHWYTEIDAPSYKSVLFIYLPWAYENAFK